MRKLRQEMLADGRNFCTANRRRGVAPKCRGFSYAEVLVCATMLTTIMSLVTVSSFRISRVWKDIRQQQAALNELSNQLDRLTALPVEQIEDSIGLLKPSDECLQCLTKPTIAGVVKEQADFGHRLTVTMTWLNDSGNRSKPLRLSAWWAEASDRKESPQ